MSALPMVRAEDIPLARRVLAFGLILLGYIFYSYAWNTVDLLRPYIRQAAGLSLQEAGLLYSAQSLGALAGAVLIGQMADRFGRRLLLVIITLGYGLALLGGLIATTFFALLLQRAVLGFFLGGVFSVAVGLYVTLFAQSIRGRLASVVGAMYGAGLVLQGSLGSWLLERDWTLMLWAGGVPPLLIAVIIWFVVPDDRRVTPYGGVIPAAPASRLPVVELFRPEWRSITFKLIALSALSFFAYQAFAGWMTTYLKEERGLAGSAIGTLIAWQGIGGIVGGFFWGWIADRMGRRIGAIGFVLTAAMVVIFLRVPADGMLLTVLGFCYSFVLSAGVAWGVYFAELYPAHLRSTAASILHWGRIISFFAPAVTAAIAAAVGLGVGMLLGAVLYGVAALVWWRLPETLAKRAPA
jgi:MFS family permease